MSTPTRKMTRQRIALLYGLAQLRRLRGFYDHCGEGPHGYDVCKDPLCFHPDHLCEVCRLDTFCSRLERLIEEVTEWTS
jgi:hypothetical protein